MVSTKKITAAKVHLLADENRYCERDAEDEVCYYDELAFKRRTLIGKKGQCPLQVNT